MGGKLLLILVRKPERKGLLGWLWYKHEDSNKIDCSSGMAVWVDLCSPIRSAPNTLLTFGFHKTWGISWYLLKNEFQSASSFNAMNQDSQHTGQSYAFVNNCVITIVLFYICEEFISIEILYQKTYTLNLSDTNSVLRNVTIFVIVEFPYAFLLVCKHIHK
jgi:hypothetical protein